MFNVYNCRLLIADDQALIRDALRRVLRSWNLKLEIAHDGIEAMKTLDSGETFAGAVLDQRMPGASGLEVTKRLRAGRLKAPHDLPLILITGHGERAVVSAAGNLGIDAVIAKPFTTKTFLKRLNKALTDPITRQSPETYAAVQLPGPRRFNSPLDASYLKGPAVVLTTKPLWLSERDLGSVRDAPRKASRLVPVSRLAEGMVLGQELYTPHGKLLAGPGLKMNARLIAKIQRLAEEINAYHYVEVMKDAGDT